MDELTESLLKTLKFYHDNQDELKNKLDKNTYILYELIINIIQIRCTIKIAANKLIQNKNQLLQNLKEEIKTLKEENTKQLSFDMRINNMVNNNYQNQIDKLNKNIAIINDISDDTMITKILNILDCTKETLDKYLKELDNKSIEILKNTSFMGVPLISNKTINYNVIEKICEYIIKNPTLLQNRRKIERYLLDDEKLKSLQLLRANSKNIIILEAKKTVDSKIQTKQQNIISKIQNARIFSPLKKYNDYVIYTKEKIYLDNIGLLKDLETIKKPKGQTLELYREAKDLLLLEIRTHKLLKKLTQIIDLNYIYRLFEQTSYYHNLNNQDNYRCFSDEELFKLIDQQVLLLQKEIDLNIQTLENRLALNAHDQKLHDLKKFPLSIDGKTTALCKSQFLISNKFTYICGLKLVEELKEPNLITAEEIMKKIHSSKYEKYINQIKKEQQKLYGYETKNQQKLPIGYQKKIKITK